MKKDYKPSVDLKKDGKEGGCEDRIAKLPKEKRAPLQEKKWKKSEKGGNKRKRLSNENGEADTRVTKERDHERLRWIRSSKKEQINQKRFREHGRNI